MFKTTLLSVLALALVNCDIKDFTDRDAYYLAQQWNSSLLDPPQEVYTRIAKDLAAIRKTFPDMKSIHYNCIQVPGQFFMTGIDMAKLNASEYGPVAVEIISQDKLLVTLNKPYHPFKLILGGIAFNIIQRFGKKEVFVKEISAVKLIGYTTQQWIIKSRYNITSLDDVEYWFLTKPHDPYPVDNDIWFEKAWVYTVKDDVVTYNPNRTVNLLKFDRLIMNNFS